MEQEKKTRKCVNSKGKLVPISSDAGNLPLISGRVPRIRNAKDAKKLLARIIGAFCRGDVLGQDAKDLCYMLSTFAQLHAVAELEARLETLETRKPEA
jgi:hypothetical protein